MYVRQRVWLTLRKGKDCKNKVGMMLNDVMYKYTFPWYKIVIIRAIKLRKINCTAFVMRINEGYKSWQEQKLRSYESYNFFFFYYYLLLRFYFSFETKKKGEWKREKVSLLVRMIALFIL